MVMVSGWGESSAALLFPCLLVHESEGFDEQFFIIVALYRPGKGTSLLSSGLSRATLQPKDYNFFSRCSYTFTEDAVFFLITSEYRELVMSGDEW
jgi:hypothetical protein